MAQLKMYWFPDTPIADYPMPEGFSVSTYKGPEDKLPWCECCKNGLVKDDATEETFDKNITRIDAINLSEDVFFIDFGGEHIGTVTAFSRDTGIGYIHMVGIRTDFRGRGLAKIMSSIALRHLRDKGVKHVMLTSDEWRKAAVKSYLTAGFLPVEYDTGMQERWEAVLEDYKIDSIQMVNNDTTPYKVIYRAGLKK